ncbi:MAG: hypothetical protein ISR96_10880 [Nitrospira sp.]|nr:hypothetical protein [Nitrospira sp.]
MRIPLVREWGSWVVLVLSMSAAVVAYSNAHGFNGLDSSVVMAMMGFALLVNTKNPLSAVLRSHKDIGSIVWFAVFFASGFVLILLSLGAGIGRFFIFAPLIVIYFLLLWSGREHHIVSELIGFAILTLAAPVLYYVMSGEIAYRLNLAVLLFFAAGVLKVRVRLRRTIQYRRTVVLYCAGAAAAFYLMGISIFLLLPLTENIFAVISMHNEKLRTTGYIELSKGLVFLILIKFFWV